MGDERFKLDCSYFPWGAKCFGPRVARELERVLFNDPSVEIQGPLSFAAGTTPLLHSILEFRNDIYKTDADYLLSDWQERLEQRLNLNRRSTHFLARYQGEIVATLRVTPPPFELSRLSPQLRMAVRGFEGYGELGRLLVDPHFRGKGVGKKLLYLATLCGVENGYSGFIAVCRFQRAREFRRFGMRAYKNKTFEIPSRKNVPYKLMWGDWKHIVWNLMAYYGVKRLSNWVCTKERAQWKSIEPVQGVLT